MKNTHKQVNWNCVLCDLLNTFNSVVIRYSPRAKRFFPAAAAAEDQFRREIKKFLCLLTTENRKVGGEIIFGASYRRIKSRVTLVKCEKAKSQPRGVRVCHNISPRDRQ